MFSHACLAAVPLRIQGLDKMNIAHNMPKWEEAQLSEVFRKHPLQRTKEKTDFSASRSQFFEESRALIKYFNGAIGGTFLELGALDGKLFSNTLVLEHKMQWKGILIEGSPKSYNALKANRPHQITVNAVMCGRHGTVHYLEGARSCCRGVVEFMLEEKRKSMKNATNKILDVPCVPLSYIFESLNVKHINLFFLDVEGAEMSVLQTIDYDSVTFDVMCVEGGKFREQQYADFLQPKGYHLMNETVKKRKNTWFIHNKFHPNSVQQS